MRKRCWYVSAVSMAISGVLLVAAGPAEAEDCPDDPKVRKITITLDYDGSKITVSPDSETIYRGSGEKPCWLVRGLQEGDWVELKDTSKETKDLKDPFNVESVKLMTGNLHFTGEKPSRSSRGRSWVYEVFVKSAGDEATKMKLDPEVIIKKGDRLGS